jgi:hypothetical protein
MGTFGYTRCLYIIIIPFDRNPLDMHSIISVSLVIIVIKGGGVGEVN